MAVFANITNDSDLGKAKSSVVVHATQKFIKKRDHELKGHLDNTADDALRMAEIRGKPYGPYREDKTEPIKALCHCSANCCYYQL
ncbi:hypothetical protein AX14_005341 [Amanita brunnescens Koide BX004]|nr:hypothetical protein AX14_005341 [Amanita brunnescens Koide BX004]